MFSHDVIESIPTWFTVKEKVSDCIISTRIRLARNLVDHQFPFRSSLLERKNVFEEVAAAIKEIPCFEHSTVMNFISLDKLHQQFLFENRIVSRELLNLEGDRGVVFNFTSPLSIMINEEDHIRMQCMMPGFQIENVWNAISEIDDRMGKEISYAYSAPRGFLTACPTNSGTGLRISFLMHLPGLVLTKTIDSVLNGATQMGISVRGFFGEHSDIIGNFFQLSNQATLGASENDFMKHTTDLIKKIILYEHSARKRILQEAKAELADKVFRAYGIMRYAHTLSMEECLNLSSAIRLGIECGMIQDMSVETLNQMILLCLPAHIELYHAREKITDDEKSVLRAELVRKYLPVL